MATTDVLIFFPLIGILLVLTHTTSIDRRNAIDTRWYGVRKVVSLIFIAGYSIGIGVSMFLLITTPHLMWVILLVILGSIDFLLIRNLLRDGTSVKERVKDKPLMYLLEFLLGSVLWYVMTMWYWEYYVWQCMYMSSFPC